MLLLYPLVCCTDLRHHHHHHHHHPFNQFRTHCPIFWPATLSLMPWQYVCISWPWILMSEACFTHKNVLRLHTSSLNKFSNVTIFAPQIIPWTALNDWRLHHLLLVKPTTGASSCPEIKFSAEGRYRLGNSTFLHVPYIKHRLLCQALF
jgi:hypothetical protein